MKDTYRIDVFPKTQFNRDKYPYILDTELDNIENGKVGIGGYSTIPRLVNKGNVYTKMLTNDMITSHRQTIMLDDNGNVMRDSNGNLQGIRPKIFKNGSIVSEALWDKESGGSKYWYNYSSNINILLNLSASDYIEIFVVYILFCMVVFYLHMA